jgi:ABC-type transport system substrate-binding protein
LTAWPDIPQLDRLVNDWVGATDQAKRKQVADEIQKAALSEVPYVPWGEWVQPTRMRFHKITWFERLRGFSTSRGCMPRLRLIIQSSGDLRSIRCL